MRARKNDTSALLNLPDPIWESRLAILEETVRPLRLLLLTVKQSTDLVVVVVVVVVVSGGCYALPTRHRTGIALQKFVKYIKT